jgi:hypothetical protein
MAKIGEFIQTSGRWLYMRELRQYLTYEGLLEGFPTVERNKQKLDQLFAEHQGKPYPGASYLIQPTETPIDYVGKPYPFGTPSTLPIITCIGRFDSLEPARDQTKDYSGLVIIWYQDEFAFPIDPIVVNEFQMIDWEHYAIDFEY